MKKECRELDLNQRFGDYWTNASKGKAMGDSLPLMQYLMKSFGYLLEAGKNFQNDAYSLKFPSLLHMHPYLFSPFGCPENHASCWSIKK